MFRAPLALFALIGFAATAVPASHAAPAVDDAPAHALLKPSVRVDGAYIRLGDLFANAGQHADDQVAAAPAPGSTALFNAAWLAATAKAHDLDWQPPNAFAASRVERSAVEIDSDQVAARLGAALGIDRPDRRVALDGRIRLYAATGSAPTIGVEHLDYEQSTGRFTAEIRVPADDPAAVPLRVAGQVQNMVQMAVVTRPIEPGEVIRGGDVATIWLRSELAPAGGVRDPRDLIGKTPMHPLRVNAPLRPLDVEVPVVVKRNDLVLIVLERPGLYLTAEGKALEDGGTGSVIRVTNVQSNRTIEATVLGGGRVAVAMPGTAMAGL